MISLIRLQLFRRVDWRENWFFQWIWISFGLVFWSFTVSVCSFRCFVSIKRSLCTWKYVVWRTPLTYRIAPLSSLWNNTASFTTFAVTKFIQFIKCWLNLFLYQLVNATINRKHSLLSLLDNMFALCVWEIDYNKSLSKKCWVT